MHSLFHLLFFNVVWSSKELPSSWLTHSSSIFICSTLLVPKMRFLFRILVLFTVTCYADESTANLLSNLVNINDQADPSLNQPIVSTNNPADSSAVYDSYVNTDSPAALTGLQPSLESPVNANGQLGSAAPYDLALVPTIPEASAGIGDPSTQHRHTLS